MPAIAPGPHVPHPLRPYEPLIINVALTGIVGQRADSGHLPLTDQEIVDDGAACVAAGAAILHIHARNADGSAAWEKERYREILLALRERCPQAILGVSTSGREEHAFRRRADVLDLDGAARPDMASLTLGSLNFRTGASVNDLQTIGRLAAAMAERGIRPELEIFDTGMGYLACELLHRGQLASPPYANLLLGGPNTAPATAAHLAGLVQTLPSGTTWAAAGLAGFQLPMNALAVFMGGHVRTGLEDNLWIDPERTALATNPGLVERVVALAEIACRPVASAAQARARIGLDATPQPAEEPARSA